MPVAQINRADGGVRTNKDAAREDGVAEADVVEILPGIAQFQARAGIGL